MGMRGSGGCDGVRCVRGVEMSAWRSEERLNGEMGV